jgi:hypothetical protein
MYLRRTTLLVFSLVLSVAPILAQSPNGAINGLILDPTSRFIAGAEIVAINDVTGLKYSTNANAEGIYVLPNLPPGPYRLQVSRQGFKTIIKPDVVLNVQDTISINFTLPVGAALETITVEGGAPVVNTQSASVSTVIDSKYVENMPLNGRSFQDLILLTPGAVTQSPQNNSALLGNTGEFSVNGQRPESNYYTVDGVSANIGTAPGTFMLEWGGASGSVPSATALGTTQGLVSVDDLQEFRVQSSTYSAEYGRNPGGQFSFETKSGSNYWHGSAYEFLRNGFFDASDWFNNYLGLHPSALRQNDFGGALGGPLSLPHVYDGKNRTFFFVSFEGLRLVQPQAATVNYVPDSATRSSAPSPLKQALNAFPMPNGPNATAGMARFIASWSNPSSLNSTSVRFDHLLNKNIGTFFRFSDTPSDGEDRATGLFVTPSMRRTTSFHSRTYTTGLNTMFTNHFSNEARLNYSSNEVVSRTVLDGFGQATPLDLPQLVGLGVNSAVSLVMLYGGYQVGIGQPSQSALQRQWNLVDGGSLAWRRHQFKFGGDYRRLTPVATPFNPLSEYLYLSQANLQSNNPLSVTQSFAAAYPLYQNFSAYLQDEWKVTSKLNLSLGLRWEINPAPGVTQGLKPYTIAGSTPSTWTLAPQGTPLWDTTWHNLAPRVGAVYSIREGSGKQMVVRGGVGVFYDTGQQMGSYGFTGPGFSTLKIIPAAFPLSPALANPAITNPPVAPYSAPVIGVSRHLQLPYTVQWNVSIDQALGRLQAVSVSYVGSHAERLPQENQLSGPAIGNPNASAFLIFENGLTSDHDALQIQFRRRLSQGLSALASYTWSHCLDYGSQNYLFSYQRGNCDFDVRQSFSSAFSYDIPRIGTAWWSRALFQHWGLDDRFSARTAFPVTLNGVSITDAATGRYYYGGLDLAPGAPLYLYGSQCAAAYGNGLSCPGGRAVNPRAFVAPVAGAAGNAPRNFVRGFGAWQMDLAVRREFPLYDRLKLQFRAEAFNLFNHPNFGRVNPSFGSNTFGQATGSLASTLGILSPLYQMGGSRSMQFALKLSF